MSLTKRQCDFLVATADIQKCFDGMASGRKHRKCVGDSLVSSGHLRIISAVTVDGDGFAVGRTERWGNCYQLTKKGRRLVRAWEKKCFRGMSERAEVNFMNGSL